MRRPLITAIVSTYNSERFMRGCLEDLLSQTLASDLEIIVIDSGSQQNEASVCREFDANTRVRYFRTEQREGLYAAWNRAVDLARGKYLTSANTDDRHRRDGLERLVGELEGSPRVVLAYGDQLTSDIENEPFDSCALRGTRQLRYPEFSPSTLMLNTTAGSQPVWRRAVHDRYGLFNPRFRISGDHEFWLRIAQTEVFSHISEPLGVFYDSPFTLSGAENAWNRDLEALEIQLMYINREPWRSDRNVRSLLARETFGVGYRYVKKQQFDRARPFLLQAWKLDPLNVHFAKTLVLRGLMESRLRLG